ncbi:MAG: hypothetical protein EXX96DRAFT_542181 [Benjaminiella poitrasii]|nr:MAG: hypothetical protein EXX96DRAFT_542181 [Benjaminiella poitrasii]
MPFNNENDYFFNPAFAAFVRSVAPPRNVLGELPLEDAGVFGDAFVETGARAEWVYVDGAVTPSPAASVVDDEIDESMEEDEESGFVDESAMDVDDEVLEITLRFSFLDVADPSIWMEGVVGIGLWGVAAGIGVSWLCRWCRLVGVAGDAFVFGSFWRLCFFLGVPRLLSWEIWSSLVSCVLLGAAGDRDVRRGFRDFKT